MRSLFLLPLALLAAPVPTAAAAPVPTAAAAPVQPGAAAPVQPGAAAPAPPAGPAPVLTLEEALRTARERQPQLRQARASTDVAHARTGQAFAPLLPQVSAQLGYRRTTGNAIPTGSVPGVSGSFDTSNAFNGSIGVSQLLWDFGATTNRWRAAQGLAVAAEDSERVAWLQTVLNVRSAWFDARANKALLAVARETLQNQKKHLDQTEAFVGSGIRPSIDVAQARTDEANAEVAQINAENAYAVSRAQLNQAMGVEGSTDYDVSDEYLPALPGEDQPLETLLAEAIKARPEVAAAEEQLRAQQLTLRATEGQYGPALSANAGFTQAGPAVDRLGWNLSAGLTLTWQIYQGGFTRAQVTEAQANLASQLAQLDLLRQQIRLEVDQVRLAVRAAKATLGAAQEALINARERLRLAEARYQTGAGSIIELGDAQVALTNASAQQVQADFRLAAARAQLLRALGRE